jgi:hypothetical protein
VAPRLVEHLECANSYEAAYDRLRRSISAFGDSAGVAVPVEHNPFREIVVLIRLSGKFRRIETFEQGHGVDRQRFRPIEKPPPSVLITDGPDTVDSEGRHLNASFG